MAQGQGEAFEDFLERMRNESRDEQTSSSVLSLSAARHEDPDQVGRNIELADEAGVAPSVVEKDPADAEAKAQQRRDAEHLAESPALRRWIDESPDHPRLAHDDVPNLSFTDRLVNLRKSYEKGTAIDEAGLLFYDMMGNQGRPRDDAERVRAEQLRAKMSTEIPDDGPVQFALQSTAELAAMFVAGQEDALSVGMTAGGAAALAGQIGPQVTVPEELVTVPAAFGAGYAAGIGAHAFKVETGHAYDEFRNLPDIYGRTVMEHDVAQGAALISGFTNGLLEVAGMKAVLDFTGLTRVFERFTRGELKRQLQRESVRQSLKTFAGNWSKAWAGEVTTEVLQEWVVMGMGELAKVADAGDYESLTADEAFDRTLEILVKVGSGMIIPAAGGSGVTLVHDLGRADKARANEELFNALADTASESKLRARAPDRYRSFVEKATEDGPVENVYIEGAKFVEYWQERGVDVQSLQRELPFLAEQQDALLAGGDIAIPTAEYAEKIAPTEHHAGLVKHLRLRAGDLSITEANQLEMDFRDELTRISEESAARAEAMADTMAPVDAVFNTMVDQQVAAGVDQSVARANAELYRTFYGTQLERGNIADVMAEFTRANVAVRSQAAGTVVGSRELAQPTPLEERLEATTPVTEYDVTFETGKPVTFKTVRNPESAPDFGERFQQNLEPAGRYLNHRFDEWVPQGWESSEVTFENPLVLPFNTDPEGGYDATSWKARLSEVFGETTGEQLSQAVRDAGFDGIVTTLDGGTREIVDLTMFEPSAEVAETQSFAEQVAEGDPVRARAVAIADSILANRVRRGLPGVPDANEAAAMYSVLAERLGEQTMEELFGDHVGLLIELENVETWNAELGRDRVTVREDQAPYSQTETDGFVQWFRGSHVMDDNGLPEVVYHITRGDFDVFTPGGDNVTLSGPAIWFGPAAARENLPAAHNVWRDDLEGANVIPAYLQMRSPLVIDDDVMLDWARELYGEGSFPHYLTENDVAAMKADGYDGIIFDPSWRDGADASGREYVVFESSQVKSAIGNVGAFSRDNPSIVAEGPYDSYAAMDAVREEADPDSVEIEEIEITAPVEPPRRAGEPLASRIPREFRQRGKVELVGQTFSSAEDLATLAQVYRDPRYETFRVFYTRNGEIVHQTGVTSRMPAASAIFLEGNAAGYEEMQRIMAETGADGYWLLHNHPSGNPSPSPQDMRVTENIAGAVPGFQGHVIIDSNKYALLELFEVEGESMAVHEVLDQEFDGTYSMEELTPHPLLGQQIASPSNLARMAKQVQASPGHMVMISGNRAGVAGIAELAPEELGDLSTARGRLKAMARIRHFARSTGAGDVFLVGVPEELRGAAMAAVRNGLLRDAIIGPIEQLSDMIMEGQLEYVSGTVQQTPGYMLGVPHRRNAMQVREEADDGRELYQSAVRLRTGATTLRKYGLNPGLRYTTREVAAALQARQQRKYGVTERGDFSPEAESRVARWMTEEVAHELRPGNEERSGVGWYTTKIQAAIDAFGEVFPELTDQTIIDDPAAPAAVRDLGTTKNARDLFTAIIAVTSDGQKATDNFRRAAQYYEVFRERGELPTSPREVTFGADRNRSIRANFANINALMAEHGPAGMHEFLQRETTVSEINAALRALGKRPSTDYRADTVMPVAAMVFGPKLGAFYANLMGSTGYLTMDRWWSRTFNRYRGELLAKVRGLRGDERDAQGNLMGLARFKSLWVEDARLSTPWEAITDEAALARVVELRESYEAKGFKNGTTLEKAANTIYKAAFLELRDTPDNASDRAFMIATVQRAQRNLRRRGYDITVADIQAILWYFEKRLYGELGAKDSRDVSYEEIALEVLTERRAGRDQPAGPDAPTDPETVIEGPDGTLVDRQAETAAETREREADDLGAPVRPGDLNEYAQAAYHGSAALFSRFDHDFMGSGEGAQQYGWGTYLGEAEAVGQAYRDQMSSGDTRVNGRGIYEVYSEIEREATILPADEATLHYEKMELLELVDHRGSVTEALEDGEHLSLEAREWLGQQEIDLPSHLYEVRVDDQVVATFLDWDAPISQQSESVRTVIQELAGDQVGADVLEQIRDAFDENGGAYTSERFERALDEAIEHGGYGEEFGSSVWDELREATGGLDVETLLAGVDSVSHEDTAGSWYRLLASTLGSDREASKALLDRGVRGIRYADALSRDEGGGTSNLVVFDPDDMTITAIDGVRIREQTGSQVNTSAEGPRPREVRRGSIQLPQSFGQGTIAINLFERANLSTFLHESGHFFLEAMRDLAERPEAGDQVKADWAKVLEWLGVEDGASIGVEQHEQWARGFEAYLREGKAPSANLRSAFDRFRSWLIALYRRLADLDVELSDEVRGVMDRMFATDQEIQDAEAEVNFGPLFDSAEKAGMTAEEHQAYLRAVTRAGAAARDRLMARQMRELERERKAWWKEQLEDQRAAVREELVQQPVYQAWHYLRTGEFLVGDAPERLEPKKLDRDALVEAFGQQVLEQLPGRGRSRLWQAKGGDHHDVVAEFFGYWSGEEMVRELNRTTPLEQAIREEADRRMLEEHGDLLSDGSIREAAIEAVHGDEQIRVIENELIVLARQAGRQEVRPRDAAKRIAEASLARRAVRAVLRPGQYLTAERRASRAAERALLADDPVNAAKHKREQLINQHLHREADRIKREVERGQRLAARLLRPAARESIHRSYYDQIEGILELFDFKRASENQLEERQRLSAFIAERTAAGDELAIPDHLVDRAQRTHYSRLTVEEFRGVIDALKNLEHLGRLRGKLELNQQRREFAEVRSDLVASARENMTFHEEPIDFAPGLFDRVRDRTRQFLAEHLKPEFLFERLDGYKAGGAWWTHLFKPLADAEAREQVLLEEYGEKLAPVFDLYTRRERARWHRKINVQGVGTFSRNSLLALALNWGNAENRRAVMDGYGWSEQQVERALARLDARDWQFVERTWEVIDELWPQVAELQERLAGVAPKKVAAEPFIAPGTNRMVRGGYYPIAFDQKRSWLAFQREQRKASEELHSSNYLRPTTRQGHTKERTGSGGQPVMLDLSVLTSHITNVIHDLTHREALVYVDKLLQDRQIRETLNRTVGREVYAVLRPWLANIASDRRDPTTSVEAIIRRARHGATVVSMGWKMTTAIVQPLGYLQSIEVIGERAAWKGLMSFYANPMKMADKVEFVMARSTMMKNRQRTFDRDVRAQMERLGAKGQLYEVHQSFFWLIGKLDMSVSIPTWLGAYDAKLAETGNEAEAIAYADRSVRMSQSSGSAKDLATIQSGGELSRMFTLFYSYFSVLNNLLRRRRHLTQGVTDIPRLIASTIYLVIAPAVLAELITGRAPDEDDEDKWAWYAKLILGYPLMSFVGVRDVVNAMTTDYGYGITPVADAFEATARTFKAAGEVLGGDELDRALAKNAVLAAGYWSALPARQVWISMEYFYDWLNGDIAEFSVYEALVTGEQED